MEIQLGDIVRMKKPHPCGGTDWEITRVGADVKLKCLTCGRVVMLERYVFEKRVKSSCATRRRKNMPVDRAERRRRMRRRETIRWARSLAIALAAALILRFFVLDFVRIAGVSMNDTLMTGDIALATKFDYWFSTPQRGDIALIRIPGREGVFVKRVIGLPGERVDIQGDATFINGAFYDEPFVQNEAREDFSIVLGEDEYLVLGDNRYSSHDSRDEDIGTLPKSAFVGRVRAIVFPFSRAGGL